LEKFGPNSFGHETGERKAKFSVWNFELLRHFQRDEYVKKLFTPTFGRIDSHQSTVGYCWRIGQESVCKF